MKLLDRALIPVREYLAGDNWETPVKGEYAKLYEDGTAQYKDTARLRLDFEANEDLDPAGIADVMEKSLKMDLEYLILYGDIGATADPLRKAMDGAEKRGKWPVAIEIFNFKGFKEHKPTKGTYEFTFFVLMKVDWE